MGSRIDELRSDVADLTKLIGLAERQRVKDLLSVEVRKIETEIIKLNEQSSAKAPLTSEPARSSHSAQRCYDVKLTNYAWDQSDKFVKLFVTLKNVQSLPAEQVGCIFTRRSVELSVKGLDQRNYFLTIVNLLKDIDETKSYWKVKSDMVVVFLTKTDPSKWSHLTASDSRLEEAQKKDLAGESGDDPSQGLMNLMKKLYNEGDDEMKRTIAKAWTEGREKNQSVLDY